MCSALELFASRFAPPGLADGGEVCISSLTGSADAFLALALTSTPDSNTQPPKHSNILPHTDSNTKTPKHSNTSLRPRIVLAITPGLPDADRLADDLRLLTSSLPTRILEFPPPLDGDRSAIGTRLKTIAALKSWGLSPYPCVVVAAFPALSTPIPVGTVPAIRLIINSNTQTPKHSNTLDTVGRDPIKFAEIFQKLANSGYNRVPMVEKEGDYSVRGGIIDAWGPGEEFPVRAEFFGEDLESLRTFDAATQRSIERIDFAELLPAAEQSADSAKTTILDLLPECSAILALEHNAYSLKGVFEGWRVGGLEGLREKCLNQDDGVTRQTAVDSQLKHSNTQTLKHFSLIYTGDPAPRGVPTYPFQTTPLPGFAELGANEAHHPELFDAARARLERHLAAAKARGALIAKIDGLSGGFEIPEWGLSPEKGGFACLSSGCLGQKSDDNRQPTADGPQPTARSRQPATDSNTQTLKHSNTSNSTNIGGLSPMHGGLLVVTKADRVFTRKHTRPVRAAGNVGARLADFDDLEPGEYVVHVDYGVGKFVGASEILLDGKRSEVFTIEYADGAKLHVPAAHAHLLSRYVGVKGQEVTLHRLDGKKWSKDKAAAQKAVADLAASLLETQAKRELVPGFSYDVNCDGREAFAAAFPFEETPDQLAAIAAIEKDLASQKPMDRLVCGDAGYGKTEVAMRAAYIAAMNGKQTAVLAPTTVLAEQHFETFTSRFDGTPVRIESVSRFQTSDTHRGTFQRLASGACDIVIGTHAILSGKVAFHDLGLIIIDEEQRFGVRHKEFLKRLRATADVLTLSATPIPRTLYLSMTGARDLSLLRTPPRERVAVETTVVRDSDAIVRHAIEAELARGGQVFFLHNRVATIGRVEKRLKEIMPKLRVVVAHGQMDARTLARKMRDFERGKYDLLLSTTIVESGIDIPRANTILVDQAHTFGLADLYQLRGRVGRSSAQGHAIFLLPADGLVDSDARERLAALKRHGGLGAGFNLAVRDLELRGAGNLLGSQQSGHIAAVGFGLYCQLLKRTVAMMKGEKVDDVVDVKLNLDFIDASPASDDADAAAALPYSYVEEDAQRIGFMKRFAEAQDEKEIKSVASELADRFGPLPPSASRLVRLAALRAKCAAARINHVDVKDSRAVFYRVGSRDVAFVRDLKGKTPDAKIRELAKAATESDGEIGGGKRS